MGRQSQTKYYLSNSCSKTTIIRRHHPLINQQLALLSVGKKTVVVRLPDGSSMKILRRWTDVDGIACTDLNGDSEISLFGLKELLSLFMALRERIGDDSEMIATEQSTVEAGDDEATTVRITRQVARLMARALVAQIRALRTDNNPEVSDDSSDG